MTDPTQGPTGQPQPAEWQPLNAAASYPLQSNPLPVKKKRNPVVWLAAGMAVLLIVAVALAGRSARQQTAEAGARSTTVVTSTTTTTTRTTTTTTTTTTRPKLPPSVFKGTGDDVVNIDRPGMKIVKFECPACTRNTVVKTNGFESLLVNEIGAYSGVMWMDIRDGSHTTTLTINASGAWTLTVGDIDMATVASGPMSGNGDGVVLFTGSSNKARITNNGARNFTVHVVSLERSTVDLAVNHIGGYEGTVPFDGPALVQISSTGAWTITPS